MHYDNTQLARVCLHAWQITRDESYRRVADLLKSPLDHVRHTGQHKDKTS